MGTCNLAGTEGIGREASRVRHSFPRYAVNHSILRVDRNLTPGVDTLIYNRTKDQGSATGQWFSELTQPNPWYKDVVPNVGGCRNTQNFKTADYFAIVRCYSQ